MPEPFGPVEYIVIHFDSDRFRADIVPALNDLLDQGLVRLIDVAAVTKSPDGVVSILETQELGPEVAERLQVGFGDELDPDTSAVAFLFEHVWATRFAAAVRGAEGRLVLSERIPHQVIAEAQASLLAVAR